MHPKRSFIEYTYINDAPSIEERFLFKIQYNEKICWKEYKETINKCFDKMYDAFFYTIVCFGYVWFFDKVSRNHEKTKQRKPNGNQIFWSVRNIAMTNNDNNSEYKFQNID